MSNGHDRNSQQSGSDSRSSAGGVSGSSYLQPQLSMSRNASATTIDSRGSASSGHQRQASASSRIAPPPAGGAGGPTPPFIKIKIFHRANDDLVAIRVPPGVTHSSLLEKVRDRLGNNINVLRYRDTSPDAPAGGSGMMRISDDEDLKEWLASGAKLTLYADSQ